MLAILLAHAIAAMVAPVCVRVLGRNAFFVLALVPIGSLPWVAGNFARTPHSHLAWVPALGIDIDLRMDSLSAILAVLVLGVGALVLGYCSRYFSDDEPRLSLFAAEMVAFAGAMFGLVVSDNLLVLYTFWEITSVLSFLLVGHYAERGSARWAAGTALFVTAAGGLIMLVGFIILGRTGGSYRLSDLVAHPPHGALTDVAVVAILIGALAKSAVVPLHFWLPGAMAAPTPVSAYLHAAAMVKAGVYLVARLAPAFADTPAWRPIVLGLGSLSMLLAGWRALRVSDLKLVLAFGTVSQLGLLMVLLGIGSESAAVAGLALLISHALFKACLFLVVGVIEHSTGTRDLRKLAHLGARAPALAVIAMLAAASMAGVPPLLGFVGKESALAALLHQQPIPEPARLALSMAFGVGSALTVGYSLRFVWGAFGWKNRAHPSNAVSRMHSPSPLLLVAPALLAGLGLVAGLVAPSLNKRLKLYTTSLSPADPHHPVYLALWHGIGWPLVLTAGVMVTGTVLFIARPVIDRLGKRVLLGNADRAYDAALRRLDRLSTWMTGSLQRGSLPLNQATLLVTFVALPIGALVVWGTGSETKVRIHLWDSPLQLAVGLLMLVAALGATVLRNRLAAVLLIGVTGYGCGVIFALHGAPDLALTQFLVETLTLVIFVLMLRKLPAEIDDDGSAGYRLPRALLGIAVGTTVTAIGGIALNSRMSQPISAAMADAAYRFGGGKNVVNVLLVDIRAWDTLGETSVLVVAATGVASLVFRHRRFGLAPRVSDAPPAVNSQVLGTIPIQVDWLLAGRLVPARHRSMVLEITTRLVFPTIMVLSVYFFFSGHNAPGGGFAGGLTAGLALVLRYLAGGRFELGEAAPVDAGQMMGIGLLCTAGTAVTSMLFGAPLLSSTTVAADLPLLGRIKFSTALFFDLGVYLIVVGLVLDVLRSMGARLDNAVENENRS